MATESGCGLERLEPQAPRATEVVCVYSAASAPHREVEEPEHLGGSYW